MMKNDKNDNSGSKGDDYNVGYQKPPVSTRFAKGVSGNPKGRSRGRKGLRTTLEAILDQKITTREGDRIRSISKVKALLSMMVNAGLKGDLEIGLKALTLAGRLEADAARGVKRRKVIEAELTDEEIVQLFIKRVPFAKLLAAMTDEQLGATENDLEKALRAED